VSDASPLIALARVDQVALLQSMFGQLLVPEAVWREVALSGADKAGSDEFLRANWIQTRSVSNQALLGLLKRDLGAGEAEAIVLAHEVKADFVLMDERLGRSLARKLGLKVVGIVGVLIEARKAGFISDAGRLADDLRDKAGFWISEELRGLVIGE
jgi:predicted nucleic acid-binding protein